ncbi:glutathione S-transferase [Ceratobasidium sp. AG-Ba]|nr:glutathione S-transferase [Ceratobasidium sp. AG-Ba]
MDTSKDFGGLASPKNQLETVEPELGPLLVAGAASDVFRVKPTSSKLVKKILRLSPKHFNDSDKERGEDVLLKYRETFDRRTLSWSQLVHPNIARISSPSSTTLSFYQEYCEKGDLRNFVKSGSGSRPICYSIIQGILEGLVYLHNRTPPIVHGSLNADKIFVALGDTVKIGEFGLAESMAEFSERVPNVSFNGLARWTSPERLQRQADGHDETASVQSDVWAFGCVLFEPYAKYKYDPKVIQRIVAGELPGDLDQITFPPPAAPSNKCNAAKPFCNQCIEQGTTDKCIYDDSSRIKSAVPKWSVPLDKQISRPNPSLVVGMLSDDEDTEAEDHATASPRPTQKETVYRRGGGSPDRDIKPRFAFKPTQNRTSASPRGDNSPFGPYRKHSHVSNASNPFVAHNRPTPSPPVFGDDTAMDLFRSWKANDTSNIGNIGNPSLTIVRNWRKGDDLLAYQQDYLLEIFLPFRKQAGLEIWVPDFLASLKSPPEDRPHLVPTVVAGLMWMIYAFAAHFSGELHLEQLVPDFLEKARRFLRRAYAEGDRLCNYIQGMTLLATMLYLRGDFKEGSLEANTACHVAVTCGLHKISSHDWTKPAPQAPPSGLLIHQVDLSLKPPASAREHGERIAAFWQLVLLDYIIAGTTALPAYFGDDGDRRSRVETVFPRSLEDYINGKASEASCATLRDIFESRFVPMSMPDTPATLQVKSMALLERAVRLGIRWGDEVDLPSTEVVEYMVERDIIKTAIEHFKSYLPPIRQPLAGIELPRTSNGLVWERLYPHLIVLTAEIQLFYLSGVKDHLDYEQCLRSARATKEIISELTDMEISQIGVVPGQCFSLTLHVLERELQRKNAMGDKASVDPITDELEVVLNALKVLGEVHHLVGNWRRFTDKLPPKVLLLSHDAYTNKRNLPSGGTLV